MANASKHFPGVISHGRPDPIRIVPLNLPASVFESADAAASAGASPQLTYRGGPLLANVEVFTVFWGSAWQGAQASLVQAINKFFDDILVSPLIDQLGEYSVPAHKIGHGKRTGSITVPVAHMPNSVSDTAIQHLIQQEIATNSAVPRPGPNTLYFVFLPPKVAVIQGGSRSCQAFCGYHSDINGQIFYAAMPYPGCTGCTGSLSVTDALTSTSSHELCEAITDAIPGQGWYDDANGEIGDICAWKTKTVAGHVVQLEWSNKHNACV
jgi:hypothetical protein